MRKLVIIGAGGFGREVVWLVERINKVKPMWKIMGFVDDDESLHGNTFSGYPVLGNCDWLMEQEIIYAICAIGLSSTRKRIVEKLNSIKFATVIDPDVIMSDRIKVGDGCIICAGTTLTVDITLKSHVIINLNCTVGHDVVINDFVTMYPCVNVSGNVVLGKCVEMGTGSQIIQGLKVGDGTIVGAGAVVVKELPKGCTAVGNPAKEIKFHKLC